jgi:ADP-heptose:LPS heptosyltransferase
VKSHAPDSEVAHNTESLGSEGNRDAGGPRTAVSVQMPSHGADALDRPSVSMPLLRPGTHYSLPGDWIDRRGKSQRSAPIRRILVIKPDHIGDLITTSDAFLLLRHFFPLAHIDLICGPWNVALARRLGVFDEVYGVTFFDEVSGRQIDGAVARDIRRRGNAELEELGLGPYDIAINLRYDRDTRKTLLGVDARIYAGWGNPQEFPFLDIAMPANDESRHANYTYEQVVMGRSFHRAVHGHAASEPFTLGPGRYAAVLRIHIPTPIKPDMSLRLILRDLDSDAILARHGVESEALRTGICDIEFMFAVETPGERLSLIVEFENAEDFDGTVIELARLRCVEKFKTNLPFSHMGDRATLLVLRVAQTFSQEAPFGTSRVRERLTAAHQVDGEFEAGSAPAIRERILAWKSCGDCVVGIALGANSETRKWPLSYFIELAKYLLSIGPVRLVFIGGPADREEAVHACRSLGLDEAIHALCGLVPLEDLGQILQPLDLFIGNNTGTTHFAGKVGVRTIAVFAGTHHPREWGPVGPNASWINRDEPCAPCYLSQLKQCRHGHVCMLDLVPADVILLVEPEVRSLLRERGRQSRRQDRAPIDMGIDS